MGSVPHSARRTWHAVLRWMYHSAPRDVVADFFFFFFPGLFVETKNEFGSKPSVGDRNINLAKQKNAGIYACERRRFYASFLFVLLLTRTHLFCGIYIYTFQFRWQNRMRRSRTLRIMCHVVPLAFFSRTQLPIKSQNKLRGKKIKKRPSLCTSMNSSLLCLSYGCISTEVSLLSFLDSAQTAWRR